MTGKNDNQNVIILTSQDWFFISDKGDKYNVFNVIYRLLDGVPDFLCDDREVLQIQFPEFWDEYVKPFLELECFVTRSGYFYFPKKAMIHISLPGRIMKISTQDNPDDEPWIVEELSDTSYPFELPRPRI